jgi:hypothetical protein
MPPTRPSQAAPTNVEEFSSGLIGFDVIDGDGERIGTVKYINPGRTCILVETGRSLFVRKHIHAVHVSAVSEIDLDAFTISLAVSKNDVAQAPELHQLDHRSETALARHYHDRVAAVGETVDTDASADPHGGQPAPRS